MLGLVQWKQKEIISYISIIYMMVLMLILIMKEEEK